MSHSETETCSFNSLGNFRALSITAFRILLKLLSSLIAVVHNACRSGSMNGASSSGELSSLSSLSLSLFCSLGEALSRPLGVSPSVMLLDWIGAGSGARSNPVQKVRPAGSWFSSRDPVALFPFSAISKQIQSGEIYTIYLNSIRKSYQIRQQYSSIPIYRAPPHCHRPHCHHQHLLLQFFHPGHQTPLHHQSHLPSSLSQGCQKPGAQVVHTKPASTHSPQLYPSGVVNDDR